MATVDTWIGITLTAIGVLILISSITALTIVMRLLGRRAYSRRRWWIVQIMLFFFVVGYIINALEMMGFTIIPLENKLLIVSLVYFFGAIFTIVTILAIRTMLRDILGKQMNDEEAIGIFSELTGVDKNTPHLTNSFFVICEICEKDIIYTVADVVRDHAFTLERGIQKEEVFGTKSFKLRPVHKCKDGRREITVVHDDSLAVRSIEENRLLYSGTL